MNKCFFFLIMSVLVASFSQILLKKSAGKTYTSVIREYVNPFVITGYGLMLVSTALTVAAYKGIELKNGAVIEALGFPVVMVLSRFFFREQITKKKLLGNSLILIGMVVFYL